MTPLNPAIARLDMPARFRKLPIDSRGYPIPCFVAWIDGKPDFRAVDTRFFVRAIKGRLCWLCGEKLGAYMAFTIGPMCAINRVTSEPPSHLDCARFACRACPFLVQPARRRDEADLPEQCVEPGGIMIARNPGVVLIWVTRSYKIFRPEAGAQGVLIHIGNPTSLEWYARGRTATREEVLASINDGLPALRAAAELQGGAAAADLDRQIALGMALVPA